MRVRVAVGARVGVRVRVMVRDGVCGNKELTIPRFHLSSTAITITITLTCP